MVEILDFCNIIESSPIARGVTMAGYGNQRPSRFRMAVQRFMMGRYGTDKLNMLLLCVGLGLTVINMFIHLPTLNMVLTLLAWLMMGLVIFRTLSRNTYKRYRENRKYLMFLERIKDREHRYYDCPKCRQQVRVPRGKGKISITCPKCREKFIKKT